MSAPRNSDVDGSRRPSTYLQKYAKAHLAYVSIFVELRLIWSENRMSVMPRQIRTVSQLSGEPTQEIHLSNLPSSDKSVNIFLDSWESGSAAANSKADCLSCSLYSKGSLPKLTAFNAGKAARIFYHPIDGFCGLPSSDVTEYVRINFSDGAHTAV